jgi:hypothetical protein
MDHIYCLFCEEKEERNLIQCCKNNHTYCNKCLKYWIIQSLTINNIISEIDQDNGEAYPRYGNCEDKIYCPICGLESNYKKNGTYIGYYKDGGKMFEFNYKDNKLDGIYRIYHPLHKGIDKIYIERNYVNGNQYGKNKTIHSNGIICDNYEVVNGMIEGLRVIKSYDGFTLYTSEYKDGLQHGTQTIYNRDGTTKTYLWENNINIK